MKKTNQAWRPQTLAVRGGLRRSNFNETAEAIYMTSGFVYANAAEAEAAFEAKAPEKEGRYIYSRFSNPTVGMLEERLSLMEGAEACRATATGMAAVFSALMCQIKAGDRVVASRALFGSCDYILSQILPKFGVHTVFVDGADLDQWAHVLDRATAAVFLETPANPTLEIIDLAAVCELAHKVGARVVVDNVFASPILQKPLKLGADVVVYSATKHIDGQGRCLGGAVLGSAEFVADQLAPFLKHTGPALSPFNAWVMLKGLETLEMRIEKQSAAAKRIAQFLSGRSSVARVRYPGLPSHPQHNLALKQMREGGTVVTFDVVGGKGAAFRCLDTLTLIDISNNLGDSKSLITHPATTTHQRVGAEARARVGISDAMVRLSVGLEDPADIEEDLARALAAA
ncbi:MAG: O-succinylhomoserine sulfhydrylase [Alphaproteobacteria bacterium]|nr:O-succinylhomoserine sulfhydrylase [Alphaproteobacteria bacterium]